MIAPSSPKIASDFVRALEVGGPTAGVERSIWSSLISDLYHEINAYHIRIHEKLEARWTRAGWVPRPESGLQKELWFNILKYIRISHIYFAPHTLAFLIKTLLELPTHVIQFSDIRRLAESLPGGEYFRMEGDAPTFREEIDFRVNVLPQLFMITVEPSTYINSRGSDKGSFHFVNKQLGARALSQDHLPHSPVKLYFNSEEEAVLAKMKL